MALLSAICTRAARALPLVALLLAERGVAAQGARASEYEVKAVFLFNFAQFVDWPPEAFSAPDTPLVICVLGQDPFGPALDQTVRDERLGGRPFQVRRYQSVDEIKTCHILFISRSEGARPDVILAGLKQRPILTVSDADGFAQRGGMIRFVTDRNRIRLQLNLAATEAAHLTISSKLLRVAEIVRRTGS